MDELLAQRVRMEIEGIDRVIARLTAGGRLLGACRPRHPGPCRHDVALRSGWLSLETPG